MRACVLRAPGTLEQVEVVDVPAPDRAPGPGTVRVALKAAALNHLDLFVVRGLREAATAPHILGADGAGVVDAVGAGVTAVAPGDRVMLNPGIADGTCTYCRAGEQSLCTSFRLLGEQLPGTFAEAIAVPARNVVRLPTLTPPLSWAEAAAFSLTHLTAWRMLMTRARLASGETVLIWGIGGGVAQAALGIAKLAQARVVVTSSSDAKLEQARARGADHGVNHRTQPVAAEVRRLTGGLGVDVVVDSIGAATWAESLRALRKGGRLVTCGATSGPDVSTDLRRLFWHQFSILGSTMGNDAEYQAVVAALARGHLRPTIDRILPLAHARAALERLEQGLQLGKVVLAIQESGGAEL
ncbi:MAG TPA: zinc-binding dehydrogenase [Gemmatimonadales bacterium]|nr:zinc-binding dehydrogenase [Gemmatimonadales bacterium]